MHIGTGLPAVPPYLPRDEATLWIVGAPELPFTSTWRSASTIPNSLHPRYKATCFPSLRTLFHLSNRKLWYRILSKKSIIVQVQSLHLVEDPFRFQPQPTIGVHIRVEQLSEQNPCLSR